MSIAPRDVRNTKAEQAAAPCTGRTHVVKENFALQWHDGPGEHAQVQQGYVLKPCSPHPGPYLSILKCGTEYRLLPLTMLVARGSREYKLVDPRRPCILSSPASCHAHRPFHHCALPIYRFITHIHLQSSRSTSIDKSSGSTAHATNAV